MSISVEDIPLCLYIIYKMIVKHNSIRVVFEDHFVYNIINTYTMGYPLSKL